MTVVATETETETGIAAEGMTETVTGAGTETGGGV